MESGPTHRCAIKEESKVANRDSADHQGCSLLQYINVIANLFKPTSSWPMPLAAMLMSGIFG